MSTNRSPTWWLNDRHSVKYMAKQASGLFLVLYALLWVYFAVAVSGGHGAFEDALAVLQSPAMLAWHAAALAFVAVHSVTWVRFMPKAMPPRLRERVAWRSLPLILVRLPLARWRILEWLAFTIGGTISALLAVPLLVVTGVIIPFTGLVTYAQAQALLHNPFAAVVTAATILVVGFHGAHRTGGLVGDLGFKNGRNIERILYSLVGLGSLVGGVALLI